MHATRGGYRLIVFAGSRNFNALSNCQPMRGVDLYLTSKAIKARARSQMDGRARVNWTDWSLHAEVSRLANIRDRKRRESNFFMWRNKDQRELDKRLGSNPCEQNRNVIVKRSGCLRPFRLIGGTSSPWSDDGWSRVKVGHEYSIVVYSCSFCGRVINSHTFASGWYYSMINEWNSPNIIELYARASTSGEIINWTHRHHPN